MAPRPDVSAERRNQILDAATLVFAQHGFALARMDDIVHESGLSKGTLYWYFNSKDEIILAILSRIMERELVDLRKLIDAPESASQRIEAFVSIVANDIAAMFPTMPLTFEFMSLSFRNETVRQAMEHYFMDYLEILTPLLQQGIERGEFHPVDPVDVAIAIGASIEGTIVLWTYNPGLVTLQKHMLKNTSLILQGLRV